MDTPPAKTDGADRRVHSRKAIRTTARLSVASGASTEVHTIDVSQGGLGISAAFNPPAGTEFRITFQLPTKNGHAELFTANVRVMYSAYASKEGGFKIGLLFNKLDADAAKQLRTFLA